ncbi:MarR family transcriptional regulator [Neolewinella lacunae]|uniref:MarR family transcriptional regulator n=1 Tax=Neolewinella lacunae TaxID=1517758 RepID=A0A923PP24_9BACT|nr:MarR family transcriptional regulator [Neolewinella lacunae]MBC6995206.1 MarR family transcriptional regulator [Neolewinella lacunae]MDN3635485.1 MarR family transcriptional regulator [Neolewinella lacunae]
MEADIPLGKVFSELAKAYAGTFTERLAHLPISRYYYALVVIEAKGGELNQTELADEIYTDKATVVRMLDYLETEGCIIRQPNPADRRAHRLELTPKALAMIPSIKEALQETNAECLAVARQFGIEELPAALAAMHSQLASEKHTPFQIHFIRREENN